MTVSFSRTIANTSPDLYAFSQELSLFLEDKLPLKAAQSIELVLEEILTNTVKYGAEAGAPRAIQVSIDLTPTEALLNIEDDGREFDPTQAPAPDLSLPPEEREIGGLGIHLTRKLSESMEYERRAGKNFLRIKVKTT